MQLPQQYNWLANEDGPRMIKEALKWFGTIEEAGNKDSPTILSWANEIGGNVDDVYKADSIAWCGLFMAIVTKRAGKPLVKDPLWALNWGTFGLKTFTPKLGDILVFTRDGGGHVGLYVGEDDEAFHVLGGNQNDCVCIKRLEKSRLYIARTPQYNVIPANVRQIILSKEGEFSNNEA